ncbi:MAG: ATPase [Alteromonadaceae bacterium]|uniref:AAA family ATPase n=1 Tax=Marinobacter sp. BGYM27 TaxID=2975597 RepID=UPI000C4279D6|nr:AAA family ATPase [Marinobacter sp. BGYM27]MAA63607.1 ATPase [Alteromonadaceae bacterium]MBH84498.1 ATPase [Alteromonadaceae bacterium]MDG5498306.1 AAA family ATPase [Marinobacter sp. BGYM27]
MSESSAQAPRHPRILAVTGGKGGIGKTSVSLNLALALSRQGNRVLLLDGDTDLANVTIMLGQYPRLSLADVLAGTCTLEQAIFEAPYGLHILPGASGVERCMGIAPSDRLAVMRGLASFEKHYDYILIDTAAGLQDNVIHMIASAALACVVVTPDPTSLTDAFSLIKVLRRRGYRRTPSVLINMAKNAGQAQGIFQRFYTALQKHLDVTPHYLGAIWRDDTLRESVRLQRPVSLSAPSDPCYRQFRVLADMLKVRFNQLEPRRSGFAAYWNRVAERQASAPQVKVAPVVIEQRWLDWSNQLQALINHPDSTSIQQYNALTSCFVQLGETINEDTIEIIQTGLASMPWERLPGAQREHFAAHLRHLADQISPPRREPARPAAPAKRRRQVPEPRYDEVRFGHQDSLLRALREQPDNVSLDTLLDTLTGGRSRK